MSLRLLQLAVSAIMVLLLLDSAVSVFLLLHEILQTLKNLIPHELREVADSIAPSIAASLLAGIRASHVVVRLTSGALTWTDSRSARSSEALLETSVDDNAADKRHFASVRIDVETRFNAREGPIIPGAGFGR